MTQMNRNDEVAFSDDIERLSDMLMILTKVKDKAQIKIDFRKMRESDDSRPLLLKWVLSEAIEELGVAPEGTEEGG